MNALYFPQKTFYETKLQDFCLLMPYIPYLDKLALCVRFWETEMDLLFFFSTFVPNTLETSDGGVISMFTAEFY